MIEEGLKPIYTTKVHKILKELEQKMSREEIAKSFGHKNYKTIDIYMRRKNFTWDGVKQTYVPKLVEGPLPSERVMPTSKEGIVIEMMKQSDFNMEEICQKAGFRDHLELVDYMTSKGYKWSHSESNYVKKTGLVMGNIKAETGKSQKERVENSLRQESMDEDTSIEDALVKLKRYFPLLEILEDNKEKLIAMITPTNQVDTIPRYIVPGRTSGKTIQMAEALQDMAVTFCNEKNIKQRELFEIALIEFFKRNGYDYAISSLMRPS